MFDAPFATQRPSTITARHFFTGCVRLDYPEKAALPTKKAPDALDGPVME